MKADAKEIGLRIKAIRQSKGMTLEEFGKLLRVNKSTVLRWEIGKAIPNTERANTITKIADITVNELLYGYPVESPEAVDIVRELLRIVEDKKSNQKAVGLRIQSIRQSKGMTLEEFGKLFNVSKSNISHWEAGNTLPNAERTKAIAKIADITVDELLHGRKINLSEVSTEALKQELFRRGEL